MKKQPERLCKQTPFQKDMIKRLCLSLSLVHTRLPEEYSKYQLFRDLLNDKYKKCISQNNKICSRLLKLFNSGREETPSFDHLTVKHWLNLKTPVPLKFIHFLKVSLKDLEELMFKEKEAFLTAFQSANYPLFFTYKVEPNHHPMVKLPDGIHEIQAIGFIQTFLKKNRQRLRKSEAYIDYPGIKQIKIRPDSFQTLIFPPQMERKKNTLEFLSPVQN